EDAPARLVAPRPRILPEPSAADLPLRPQAQPVGQTLAGAAERDPLAKVGVVPPIRVRRLRGGPTIAGVLAFQRRAHQFVKRCRLEHLPDAVSDGCQPAV